MKRIILTVMFGLIACVQGFAQFRCCVYYDGYWGDWHGVSNKLYGNNSTMIIYVPEYHRSYYQFKFTIENYYVPTKDEKKRRLKSKEWYQYNGTVEYYVTDDYPTIKDVFKKNAFPSICPAIHRIEAGETPCAKRTAKATIKIEPYKDHPQVYNIWFEDVGFGINLNGLYFND